MFVRGADLEEANLRDVTLSRAWVIAANLERADLRGANVSGADLTGANLSDTDMQSTTLSGANLSRANLYGSIGIDVQKLSNEAKSLEGATMPNGQKYEDWLKSKSKGRMGRTAVLSKGLRHP
jgi:uncharacterized protein YjbI with pentapeptide repeats